MRVRRKLVFTISSLITISVLVFGGWILIHRSEQIDSGITRTGDTTQSSSVALDSAATSLAKLSLEEQVGQLLITGFGGKVPDSYISSALKLNDFGGVILYGYNIQDSNQVKALTKTLRELAMTTPLIAVDQEGGPVVRVSWDPTASIGQKDIHDPQTALKVARRRGVFLKNLGINLNLAPVVDTVTDPLAALYPRSFTKDWGSLGGAMVTGYQESGVLATVKHFPSFGNFIGNAETEIPTKELSAVEKNNFIEALRSASIFMVSPVIVKNIDPINPAPISKKVIDYIRNVIGFKGVIMTDDIEMKSVVKNYDPVDFALKAYEAGVDLLLFSGNPQTTTDVYKDILAKVKNNQAEIKRLQKSVIKILELKMAVD